MSPCRIFQIKVLREKLDTYMKSAVEYEDERRKNATLRAHMESLQKNLQERDAKIDDTGKQLSKVSFFRLDWSRSHRSETTRLKSCAFWSPKNFGG